MIKVEIISVGKLKENFWKSAINEYAKRLKVFCNFSILEVKDEKIADNISDNEITKIKEIEGKRILSRIKQDSFIFCLDMRGKEYSSEKFAARLNKLATYDTSKFVFIIGGSLGLSQEVLNMADERVSFGKFTLPHQLMRVVLTEQIYRSFMINNGRVYHK